MGTVMIEEEKAGRFAPAFFVAASHRNVRWPFQ